MWALNAQSAALTLPLTAVSTETGIAAANPLRAGALVGAVLAHT